MFQPHIVLFQPHPSAELNPSKATNADLHGKLWELELGIIPSKNGFRFVHTLVCRFYLNFISQWYLRNGAHSHNKLIVTQQRQAEPTTACPSNVQPVPRLADARQVAVHVKRRRTQPGMLPLVGGKR